MLTQDLLVKNCDNLQSLISKIDEADLVLLIEWLKEKDDTVRYTAFLLLQLLSAGSNRVYKYWNIFAAMIDNPNSYQRNLGLMLIAANIKWDINNNFDKIYSNYLEHCDDEKFITARQCIQGLNKILAHTRKYRREIVDTLLGIDLKTKKDTQQGLLLLDIIAVLGMLYADQKEERIESYLKAQYELACLSGNDKTKQKIKAILEPKKN
jgi:hypothetical protein